MTHLNPLLFLLLTLLLAGCGGKSDHKPSSQDPDAEPPAYAVGQVWNYDARKEDDGSQLTIIAVDVNDALGTIYGVRVEGVQIEAGARNLQEHLPVSATSLDASVTTLDRTLASPPPSNPSYLKWKERFGRDEADIFAKPIKVLIQDLAEIRSLKAVDSTPDPDNLDFAKFLEKANNHLATLTAAHEATWRIGKAENWFADQGTSELKWTFEDGVVVTAPMQIIGTYNTTDQSFLWGWDHPSVVEGLGEDAAKVLAYANKNKVEHLTQRLVRCTEEEAWEFAALATLLCNRQGAYRGPAGPTMIFMTFGELKISKAP